MSQAHKEIRARKVCDEDKTDFQTTREALSEEEGMMINDEQNWDK